MKNTNLQDLNTDTIEYIEKLELHNDQLANQVSRLTEILQKMRKSLYGQSSEKTRYVLSDGTEQLSVFNEAESGADKKHRSP